MMNPHNAHLIQQNFHRACESCFGRRALQLYRRARLKGMLRLAGCLFMTRYRRLRSLHDSVQMHAPGSPIARRVQSVALDQIQGSEGRSRDFDCAFYPLRDHLRERWLHIASARARGIVLPPVELIHVGDRYFVRDGHHRISVARAFGEAFIDAEVIDWISPAIQSPGLAIIAAKE